MVLESLLFDFRQSHLQPDGVCQELFGFLEPWLDFFIDEIRVPVIVRAKLIPGVEEVCDSAVEALNSRLLLLLCFFFTRAGAGAGA